MYNMKSKKINKTTILANIHELLNNLNEQEVLYRLHSSVNYLSIMYTS